MKQCSLRVHREVSNQLHRESESRVTERLARSLTSEVTIDVSLAVATEVFEQDVLARRQQLADAERATQLLRMRRFLLRWKNQHAGDECRKWVLCIYIYIYIYATVALLCGTVLCYGHRSPVVSAPACQVCS